MHWNAEDHKNKIICVCIKKCIHSSICYKLYVFIQYVSLHGVCVLYIQLCVFTWSMCALHTVMCLLYTVCELYIQYVCFTYSMCAYIQSMCLHTVCVLIYSMFDIHRVCVYTVCMLYIQYVSFTNSMCALNTICVLNKVCAL